MREKFPNQDDNKSESFFSLFDGSNQAPSVQSLQSSAFIMHIYESDSQQSGKNQLNKLSLSDSLNSSQNFDSQCKKIKKRPKRKRRERKFQSSSSSVALNFLLNNQQSDSIEDCLLHECGCKDVCLGKNCVCSTYQDQCVQGLCCPSCISAKEIKGKNGQNQIAQRETLKQQKVQLDNYIHKNNKISNETVFNSGINNRNIIIINDNNINHFGVNNINHNHSVSLHCFCKNSKCEKLYCSCYSNGRKCDPLKCKCQGCANKDEGDQGTVHPSSTNKAWIRKQKINNLINNSLQQASILFCNCRKSHCSKNYCVCFLNGVKCGQMCSCLECQNNFAAIERAQRAAQASERAAAAAAAMSTFNQLEIDCFFFAENYDHIDMPTSMEFVPFDFKKFKLQFLSNH